MSKHEQNLWELIYELKDYIFRKSSKNLDELLEDIITMEEESAMYGDEGIDYFADYEDLDEEEWLDFLDDLE